ncbi:MAG: hypothetical protein HRF45_05520 [Fimbriimonadia bacterium]
MRLWTTLLLSTACAAVQAQEGTIRELLSGSKYPKFITAEQGEADYMPVQIEAGSGMSALMAMFVGVAGGMGGPAFPPAYTKGDTVRIGEKTYLVAYVLPPDLMRGMMGAMDVAIPGEPGIEVGPGEPGDEPDEPPMMGPQDRPPFGPSDPPKPSRYVLTFYNLDLLGSISPWFPPEPPPFER